MTTVLAFLILLFSSTAESAPPSGFVVDAIGGDFECVVGAHALPDGRVIAWERSGKLWMIDRSGQRIANPILDISDEVQAGGDCGLLGLAVHPNFPSIPHVYLLYVVDRHHLLYAGTPDYSATANLYFQATIGRVTRYTLDATTGFTSAIMSSRKVLVGSTPSDGIPVLYSSHSVGQLVFGSDGSLLVSTGDNANFSVIDTGGSTLNPNVTQALQDGIIRPEEDVGAFRSQVLDSLCGKILRLDPETGHGAPGNPWFDANSPSSPRSRVWTLGLRNPFRMAIVPNTGSHEMELADPGTLLIGDVGWGLPGSERIVVVKRGGLNTGWPLFEGLQYNENYWRPMILDQSMPLPDGSVVPFADRMQPAARVAEPFVLSNRIAQAEQAEASTDVGAQVGNFRTGYLGTGFRSLWTGRFVQFALVQPSLGEATAAIRYSQNGTDTIALSILLDGVPVSGSWSAPPTGSATAWRVLRIPLGSLHPGIHALRVTKVSGSSAFAADGAWLEGVSTEHLVPSSIPTFVQHQPLICWRDDARTPGFDVNGVPSGFVVGSPEGAQGSNFSGTCAVGGPWVDFPSWPAEHRGLYFGDYSAGWIRRLDATLSGSCGSTSRDCQCAGVVHRVDQFDSGVQLLVGLFADPYSESVLSAQWVKLKRYRWLPAGSLAPEVSVAMSTQYGASPLTIQFDAARSRDPEGEPLSFEWDFGDGSPRSFVPSPTHTFESSNSMPNRFDVTLHVRDPGGAQSTWTTVVGVNNTPPVPQIMSPTQGQQFSTRRDITLPLIGTAHDLEHETGALTFEWDVVLHHNTHTHPEPSIRGDVAETILPAIHCSDTDTYWYDISLTVRDAHGLASSASVRIDPDCTGRVGCLGDCDANGLVDIGDLQLILLAFGTADPVTDIDLDGNVDTADVSLLLINWGECEPL